MYCVYVLKSFNKNKVYIGYTDNLNRRLLEHQNGAVETTKKWLPLALIYYEAYKVKKDALIREKKLKQFKNGYLKLKMRIVNSLINDKK